MTSVRDSSRPALRRPLACALALAAAAGGGCKDSEGDAEGRGGAPERAAEPAAEPEADTKPPPAAAEVPASLPGDPGTSTGEAAWAVRFGGPHKDAARGVATAGADAVVVGYVSKRVDLGGREATATGLDAYVTRRGDGGAHAWSKVFGGDGDDIANAVAVAEDGGIIVAGSFADTLDMGDGALEGAGADDIFVARFSATGERAWARSFGGRDVDAAQHVSVGPRGRVLVTGVFRETADFGARSLKSAGDADIFALALSPAGEPIWVRRFGARGADYGRALAATPSGGAALLAEFSLDVAVGDHALESSGNRDLLLAALGDDGEPTWAKSFGSDYNDVGVDLAVDPAGNLVATGSFDDAIDFGGGDLEAKGLSDAFIARFDTAGEHLWSHGFGGEDEDIGAGVATDAYGNVIATGWFQGEIDFGGDPLASAGLKDGYAVKLSPAGDHLWSQRFGGERHDLGRAVATDGEGRALVVGTFHAEATLGDATLTAAREQGARIPYGDAFVAQLAP